MRIIHTIHQILFKTFFFLDFGVMYYFIILFDYEWVDDYNVFMMMTTTTTTMKATKTTTCKGYVDKKSMIISITYVNEEKKIRL